MRLEKYIDHTILKPDASSDDIIRICQEAIKYGFYAVCVNSCHTQLAKRELGDSNVKLATVVGFPLGATSTKTKAFETMDAVENGANEIDMVINIGALKDANEEYLFKDIEAVVLAAGKGVLVKVIIETSLLSSREKVLVCKLAKKAGADFVKTSTGFSKGGATVEDVSLMRQAVGPNLGVKASGGIRDYLTARSLIEAGASRLGASSSVDIVKSIK